MPCIHRADGPVVEISGYEGQRYVVEILDHELESEAAGTVRIRIERNDPDREWTLGRPEPFWAAGWTLRMARARNGDHWTVAEVVGVRIVN